MAIDKIKVNGVTEDINAHSSQYAHYALTLSSDYGEAVFERHAYQGQIQTSFHVTDDDGFDKAVLAWGSDLLQPKGLTLYQDTSDGSTNHARIELAFMDNAGQIFLYDEDNKCTEIRSTKILIPNHLTLTAKSIFNDYIDSRLEIHSGSNAIPGYTKIILGGKTGTYGTEHAEFRFEDKGLLLNRDIWMKDPNDSSGDVNYPKLVLNTGAQTLNSTQKTQVLSNIGAAPIDHATAGDIYGKATTTKYGHVKLNNDTLNASSTGSSGIACSTGHKHNQYLEVVSWNSSSGNLILKVNN